MNEENNFVPYKIVKELEKIGFKGPSIGLYYNKGKKMYYGNTAFTSIKHESTLAPLYSEVFRWFRENHNLTHVIERDGGWWLVKILDYSNENEEPPSEINFDFRVKDDTYEEAETACLKQLIKLVVK